MKTGKRSIISAIVLFPVLLVLLACSAAWSAEPVCARVKIEILQELAFERLAFDARLIVTNSTPDQNLENMSVNVQITDESGADMKEKFFIKVVSLDKINAVDGTGSIPPQVAAEVHWMIIPSPGAGGTLQIGRRYFVGGEVNFTVGGTLQTMTLMPAMITVKPQPELILDYFLPREVWADDPFTGTVEAPVPFHLGVRVDNNGFGAATNLTINSGQPKIVENKQGLLIDFRLLGSAVNDKAVTPTLNLNIGTIAPQTCATGRWDMITTLSGRFVDFNASFTHASELGGSLTSLIKEVKTHFLVHEVLVDTPGSDLLKDFLSYDNPLGDRMPDTIYTSDCNQLPVNVSAASTVGTPTPGNPTVTLNNATLTGWVYSKVEDPGNGKLNVTAVTRSDGKRINLANVWISEEKPTSKQQDPSAFFLHILDLDTTGSYQVTYQTPAVDSTPPVTTLEVTEPKFGTAPVYVTPTTNILFTASDNLSGVLSMEYNLDDKGYVPALPFTFQREIIAPAILEGLHSVVFRSTDRAGNQEQPQTATFFVDAAPPVISGLSATPTAITPSAPDSSVLPRQTVISATASDAISSITVLYEIASGAASDDAGFAALPIVRTLNGTLLSGTPAATIWNGRNSIGGIVPAGVYTLRLTATDQLGNRSVQFTQLTVSEYLSVRPLSATAAAQINPAISGSRIAWQDFRNGKWDIFVRDFTGGAETNLTAAKSLADQSNPSLDGSRLVWQDRSSGNWDIVMYDLDSQTETPIASTLADETNPVVRGNWVAWQAGPAGNRDIYLYNISTQLIERITTDIRDQIRPVISGSTLLWEDYRNGLADLYVKDLVSEAVTQLTDNSDNQTWPTLSGSALAWLDQRHGNRELYAGSLGGPSQTRLSYTSSDEAQPHLDGSSMVYVDYAAGTDDPNLSIINLVNRRSARILSEAHRQENPRLDGNRLVWQDDRSGTWQIYVSEIPLTPAVAVRPLAAGLNLIGVPAALKSQFPSAFTLLSAWKASSYPVTAIEGYHPASGALQRAELSQNNTPTGSDFALTENGALYIHATGNAELNLGEIVSCSAVTLKAGFNMFSYACLPDNFMASDLARSLGLASIQSIARFDQLSGRWLTTAVKAGTTPEGEDFPIIPGEGYLIYTTADVTGWTP